MLTVYAPAGLSLVLDFLVLVALDVVNWENVAELARVKRAGPAGWIFVLESEGFVEHFSYAGRADWTAVNVCAGVIAEVLATYLAVPKWRHCGVNEVAEVVPSFVALKWETAGSHPWTAQSEQRVPSR